MGCTQSNAERVIVIRPRAETVNSQIVNLYEVLGNAITTMEEAWIKLRAIAQSSKYMCIKAFLSGEIDLEEEVRTRGIWKDVAEFSGSLDLIESEIGKLYAVAIMNALGLDHTIAKSTIRGDLSTLTRKYNELAHDAAHYLSIIADVESDLEYCYRGIKVFRPNSLAVKSAEF